MYVPKKTLKTHRNHHYHHHYYYYQSPRIVLKASSSECGKSQKRECEVKKIC